MSEKIRENKANQSPASTSSSSTNDKEEEAYQNPTLPEELVYLKNNDLIGDTVISKQKVLSILLKLVEEVKSNLGADNTEKAKEPSDLEDELENDLCNLWDISADLDVTKVLDELNSIDIFEQYISCYHGAYPRAIEIIIGILANMASLDTRICEKILTNKSLIKFFTDIIFYDLDDTQTLIQLLRLFNVFLTDEQSQKEFLVNLTIDNDFINFINFILDQSLNLNLLDLIIEFLINLFDIDEKILDKFSENSSFLNSLLNSILTRYNSFSKSHGDEYADAEAGVNDSEENDTNIEILDLTFKNYFICLQYLSTCENGVQQLCLINENLLRILNIYISKYLDYFSNEANSFDANIYFKNQIFIQNFVCFFSVANVILFNDSSDYLNFEKFPHADKISQFDRLISDLINICKWFFTRFEQLHPDEIVDGLKNYKIAFNFIEEFLKFLLNEKTFNKFEFYNKQKLCLEKLFKNYEDYRKVNKNHIL